MRKYLTLTLFLASSAGATVITLGPSSQSVTFTGTGINNPATGLGTARISWGSCAFDGSNTTCTVSGPYTGLGNGGTYTFLLVYPGSGASPLGSVASRVGTDLVSFTLSAGTFSFFITPTGGSPIPFYNLNFSVFFSAATDSCTGVGTCSVGAVGTTTGATITGPVNGTFDATPVVSVSGRRDFGQRLWRFQRHLTRNMD